MTISFKISKTGSRYHPKPTYPTRSTTGAGEDEPNAAVSAVAAAAKESDDLNSFHTGNTPVTGEGETSKNKRTAENEIPDDQISFTLNLFDDGYSIGKPMQNASDRQTFMGAPKSLLRYNGSADTLFSAIESGRIPGDILDDLPCRYVNGAIFCEVWDYRRCTSEERLDVASGNSSPVITRVCLKMSLEQVVKDIQAMAGYHWTYVDFLEVESRILKHLWPELLLDPRQERLFESLAPTELNLGLRDMWQKKPSDSPEVAESSNNMSKGKQVCFDSVSDSSSLGQLGSLLHQWARDDVNLQMVDNPVGQSSSPLTNEKARLMHTGADGNQLLLGQQMENLHEPDLQMKKALLKQQLIARGMQYPSNDMQRFYPEVFMGGLNQETSTVPFNFEQQGTGYNFLDLGEMQILDKPELGHINMVESEITTNDPQISLLQQYMSEQNMRSSSAQNLWNNVDRPHDNKSRKKNSSKKRKSIQARASAGGLPPSPLSSRSGEIIGSVGPQFGAAVTSGLMLSQKEKSSIFSVPSATGAIKPSFTDSGMQHQNYAQAAAIHRSNLLPKMPEVSGVGSPAAFDNISLPKNANSPPVGTQPLADPAVLDRFSKIKIATSRYQLNHKKLKVDKYPIRNPNAYSAELLGDHLSSNLQNEDLKDVASNMPLSKSLVGGNMNVCKTRILNFSQTDSTVEGNVLQVVPKGKFRMIMSEKPYDGAVAIHLGEIAEAEYLAVEDYLPTLPNTHMGDLLAAQLCSLMAREGYCVEDHLQPKPVQVYHSSATYLHAPRISPGDATAKIQQFPEGVSGQCYNDIATSSISGNGTVNSSQNRRVPRMLPPRDVQPSQPFQGPLPGVSAPSGTHKPESPALQQRQLQHPQQNPLTKHQISQFQRSSTLHATNSMHHLNNVAQHANIPFGAHMANNSSSLQPQLLQPPHQFFQSRQQLSPPQRQKNLVNGLGSVGVSNISTNPIRLRGPGNVKGIGDGNGVAGTGFSVPIGPISSIGSTIQNPVDLSSTSNVSNALHSGTLTPDQAVFMRLKMAQNRSNPFVSSHPNVGGMPGARQTHPGSSGHSVLPPPLNQMQHTDMGAMGVMLGMHLNLHEHQQLQQLMRQRQQQHIKLQQETTPSPQAFTPPQHLGSPLVMGISHQTNPFQQQLPQQQMSQHQTNPFQQQLPQQQMSQHQINPFQQ